MQIPALNHDGQAYLLTDGTSESVYYVRDKQTYKRSRVNGFPEWQFCKEREVDRSIFWAVVALIERRQCNASH